MNHTNNSQQDKADQATDYQHLYICPNIAIPLKPLTIELKIFRKILPSATLFPNKYSSNITDK